MSRSYKKLAGVGGSALMVAMLGTSQVAAFAAEEVQPSAPDGEAGVTEAQEGVTASLQRPCEVAGAFSFSQGIAATAEEAAAAMAHAANYLCGATFSDIDGDGADEASVHAWVLSVEGAVGNAIHAPFGELAEEVGIQEATMSCSCAGNPADGAASANAEVRGVSVASMLEEADASLDANTIVFTSADGYEVALPLSYVVQRMSVIVYAVNGEDICDNIGGTNQLWLGSTSGRYFVRNVSAISLETRQTPPPVPGTAEAGDTYANVPNISVAFGGQA